jgi:hypothetical protein
MANIYKNSKLDLTTASATPLYAVPSNSRAIIKSILVCDDSGSGSTITVTITDISSNIFVLFNVKKCNWKYNRTIVIRTISVRRK